MTHADDVTAAHAQRTDVIALTVGEPAGIGLDIAVMAWARRAALGLPTFALYGDPASISARAAQLRIMAPLAIVGDPSEAAASFAERLPVRSVAVAAPVVAGKPDPANAAGIIASIELAVADVMAGRALALTTGPIAKSTLYAGGFRHPGHTEFLAELAGRHIPGRRWTSVMMLACDTLKVVPLTVHVPIKAVPLLIDRDLILETVRITAAAMRNDFGCADPRIAICALNPHAGESGTIGREEVDVIAPALAELRSEGLEIVGPFSADTMFHDAARKRYDVAIAMYHDQALIPIKTLAFDSAVNVTLGLPFVRTSPDHGTAFDIAGTGAASIESLVAALRLAALTGARRRQAQSR